MKRTTCPAVAMLPAILLAVLAGCAGTGSEPAPAATADEAVTRVTRGLAENRPEVVWYALPAGYQSDLENLVHDAAQRMDAEVWNQAWAVLGKATRILREKRDFILAMEPFAGRRAEMEPGWDAVVSMAEVLVESELANLESMRGLDVERFLSGTGARLMERATEALALLDGSYAESMAGLKAATATVLSSEGDTARVRMEAPDTPATEEDFVRVEGKWIPRSLADGWDDQMASIRLDLDEQMGPGAWEREKQTVLIQLGMIEAALDGVLATKTAAEFEAAAKAAMGTLLGAAMGQGLLGH